MNDIELPTRGDRDNASTCRECETREPEYCSACYQGLQERLREVQRKVEYCDQFLELMDYSKLTSLIQIIDHMLAKDASAQELGDCMANKISEIMEQIGSFRGAGIELPGSD